MTDTSGLHLEFRQAWHDAEGQDFASRMRRQSLEASASQILELEPILFELKYRYQAELDLHLGGSAVRGHETDAARFSDLVRGIADAVKEITQSVIGRQRMAPGLLISAVVPGSVRVTMRAAAPEELDGSIKEARTETEDSQSLRVVATVLARAQSDSQIENLSVLSGLVTKLPTGARPGLRRAAKAIALAEWQIEGELRRPNGDRLQLSLDPKGAKSLLSVLDDKEIESSEAELTGYVDGQRRSVGAMWFVPDNAPAIEAAVIEIELLNQVAVLAADGKRSRASFKVVTKFPRGARAAARDSYILDSIESI